MKRFITISLLSALWLPMLACMWFDNHNYYLYKIYDNREFKDRMQEACNANWKAYLGSTSEYYWFDADELIKAARQKGDDLMVGYVEHLQRYLQCVDIEQQKQYEWNYPSREEIDQCNKDLTAIRTYALSKTKTRLRSQHALLYMRCNMMLGRHQENITYWEQTASQFIETVYRDMMKNIYAGALYKTGQEDLAGEMFAEMGDYESLMTQYYKKRSFLAIQKEYRKNPNAKVLPFLLQDFVNNVQEAIDALSEQFGGKLFIRDISRQEAQQMIQFCEQVVQEGKTETPTMWKSAKAWIEYLIDKRQEAARDIIAAAGLQGTDRMKDCTRELMLYITAAQAQPSQDFDDYLADELQWLKGREDAEAYNALDRLSHQILFSRYADKPERVAALMDFNRGTSGDMLDTLRVDKVEKYLFYRNTPATNNLDRLLKSKPLEPAEQMALEELIGTKYMRICQWDKAIEWLKNIPTSFYTECGYAVYIANRSYTVEPWAKRQWLRDDVTYSDTKWKIQENPKLKFAREMQTMEASLSVLSGNSLEQRLYELAVRYAQASYRGDCWWLMKNSKSPYDTLSVNSADLLAKSVGLLRQTALSTDLDMKLQSLFALGWREFYNDGQFWCEKVWDSEASCYVDRYDPQSPQYRAYQTLYDILYEEPEEPMYVSRCDEFRQFRIHSHYRQQRQ